MRGDVVDGLRGGRDHRKGRRRTVLHVTLLAVPVVAVTAVLSLRVAHPHTPAPPRTSDPTVPGRRVQVVPATRVFTTGRVGVFQRGAPLDRSPVQLTIRKTVSADLAQQTATAVLAVLPLADVPPSCVERATLDLDVTAATGVPAELGVYPGAATSLVGDGTPRSGEDDAAFLLDIQPRGLVTLVRPGPTSVDITDLYRLWAAGKAFPSGHKVAPGTPLLLVLRPSAADPGVWTLSLKGAPNVTYVSDPACH